MAQCAIPARTCLQVCDFENALMGLQGQMPPSVEEKLPYTTVKCLAMNDAVLVLVAILEYCSFIESAFAPALRA